MSKAFDQPDPFALFFDIEELRYFQEKVIKKLCVDRKNENQMFNYDYFLPSLFNAKPPFILPSLIKNASSRVEDLIKYSDHVISDLYGKPEEKEIIHSICSDYKCTIILLIYYTLCYLFQDKSHFLYTACLCQHPPGLYAWETFKPTSQNTTWTTMIPASDTTPCYTIIDSQRKKYLNSNSSRKIALLLDDSSRSIVKPLCSVAHDDNYPNYYFLTRFQYPVSLAIAELIPATLKYDSITAKLDANVKKPATKKSNLKEVISALYIFYRKVCYFCLETGSLAHNLLSYYKLEYGLGITTLVQTIHMMKIGNLLSHDKSYDSENTKHMLLELQRHPAIIEKDYVLSTLSNKITLNDFNNVLRTISIKNIIKITRMTFSIIFDLFYPKICSSSIPSNWSPTVLIGLLEDYIDTKLHDASIQSFSTAPINISDGILPWMYIFKRMRLLAQFSADRQSTEAANLTKLQVSDELEKYDNIKFEIKELMHAIGDLSDEQIETLCEYILTRYGAAWWEDIHSLFSLS